MRTRCRSCDAPIEMLRTPRNRWMPLDLEAGLGGNVRVGDDQIAVTLAGADLELARGRGELLRTSHFATCPNAAQHRRR